MNAVDSTRSGNRVKRANGVNPTGAEQNETSARASTIFQQIDGPKQVVFQQLPGTRFSVPASQHAWLCCGINHPIGSGKRLQVARHADIAMKQLHA